MIMLRNLRDRLLESGTVQKLCQGMGIDSHQYRLLLGLFGTLGGRLEVMGSTMGLGRVAGFYLGSSLLMSLIALGNPALQTYLLFMLGYSMFAMLLILLQDAAESIMNPDEASVLAHQPINGATYVAAKLTHLLTVVAVIIPSLNLIPAVAGLYLRESHWFYPLTHLVAAYCAGLFVAFLVCGIYGWILLYISPAKSKSAALWLQLAVVLALPLIGIAQMLFKSKALAYTAARVLDSSWMPWRWFVALGLMGQAEYSGYYAWEAVAACLLTSALIAFGLRGFRADYLVRVSTLIQGSAASIDRHPRRSGLSALVRKLTGAPSGFGAFKFTSIMFRRDWNFRRQAFPAIAMFLVYALAAVIAGIRVSPFASGRFSIRDFSPMHGFPHCLGVALAAACTMLCYTAEPQGSSMFISLPLGPVRAFVRGIYLSLWMPFVGATHLMILCPCIWFWGLAHGVLFIIFSTALVSFYLGLTLFIVEGLPFANVFKTSMGSTTPMVILIGLIPVFLFAIIQWLVFRSMALVLGATVLMAILAFVIAHFSLGKLEKEISSNLQLLGLGPQHMFTELE
ncbi:MAG TPA: hypothetical protein VE398_16495 [Acidobacteriota bacterium]|nr:hypothetical protein [Acidobacteriota bacterium]